MTEYRILCEECDQESTVVVDEYNTIPVEFCPCCGRRTIPEELSEDE